MQKDYSSYKINSNNYENGEKSTGYIHLSPLGTGIKKYKTPLSILDRLTIRLLTPYGYDLKINPDSFEIKNIYVNDNKIHI